MILSSIKTLNIKQQTGNDKTALTSCSKYAIASAHTSWHECWFIITCIRKQPLRCTEGHLLFTLASSFCLCKETSLFLSMMACHNRQTFFTVPAIMKICSLYWVVSYKGRQSLICALWNMFLYFCMCLQDASPQSGLLQSSIITMYTMYITWSAMTNNPSKLHIKKISEYIYCLSLVSLFILWAFILFLLRLMQYLVSFVVPYKPDAQLL